VIQMVYHRRGGGAPAAGSVGLQWTQRDGRGIRVADEQILAAALAVYQEFDPEPLARSIHPDDDRQMRAFVRVCAWLGIKS
jgi:hypothetical protein